jgi:hypothetical protein
MFEKNSNQSLENSPYSAAARGFGQMFGLHPAMAGLTLIVNIIRVTTLLVVLGTVSLSSSVIAQQTTSSSAQPAPSAQGCTAPAAPSGPNWLDSHVRFRVPKILQKKVTELGQRTGIQIMPGSISPGQIVTPQVSAPCPAPVQNPAAQTQAATPASTTPATPTPVPTPTPASQGTQPPTAQVAPTATNQ